MVLLALLGALQGGQWTSWPAHPTVGDTVWVERLVTAPAGWRVRAGRLDASEYAEALTDPMVLRHEDGWLVRYGVVAWKAGSVRLTFPPLWRLGPGGEADSLAASATTLNVRSVLPDGVAEPAPRPALAPLWPEVRRPVAPMLAGGVAFIVLVAAVAVRRRAQRVLPEPAPPVTDPPVADQRWLRAGEPRAVAARAAADLRGALARAVPEAHPALSTFEALAVASRALPDAPYRELAALLNALDQVAFAAVHGAAVPQLAEQARTWERRLAGAR